MKFISYTLAAALSISTTSPVCAQTILELIKTRPDEFSTFIAAIDATGWSLDYGPITVFAPTNEAFAKLPAGILDDLLLPENNDQLTNILGYHIVPGEVYDLEDGDVLPTFNGATVKVYSSINGVKINDANVIDGVIIASNGVFYPYNKLWTCYYYFTSSSRI